MKSKIALTLAGDYLHIQPVRVEPPARLVHLGRRLLRPRKATGLSDSPPSVKGVFQILAAAAPLAEALEAAWLELAKSIDSSPQKLDLEVRLGFAHARMGVLRLADGEGARVKPAVGEMLVNAWVRQTWAIDPQGEVVRWRQMDRLPNIVVSCVPRTLVESLERFCSARDLRLVSCMPAVMSALRSVQNDKGIASDMTLACTEGTSTALRGDIVQLLRLRGHELDEAWRGRLPHVPSTEGDEALQGAIRRFQVYCKQPSGEAVYRWHVPVPVLGGSH